MKHERLKVLELLDQGKITADEAAKLMESMKRSQDNDGWQMFDGDTVEHVEEKFARFTKHVDNFTREFGSKVEAVYKEVEPKIKKASQAVLEKTASVFDEISKSLNESLENARKSAEKPCDEPEGCCCNAEDPQADDDAPREN
ncbi:MAG: hypothetical protein LBR83_10085 [Clostridiales bacterium]|jgi:polyhydroxyalkanoate synthesis regulator phasin|nr:hypothetical protein [Clostridiales bacterium]